MMWQNDLNNKIAIITGVSKGIGLATAKAMLDQGMKVAGWSRSMPDLFHPDFFFIETDISNYEAVQKAYEATVDRFGEQISVLINNAGLGFEGAFEEMPVENWLQMFDTNVHGLFYCSKVVIPQMKSRDEGHIVNIASIAGTTGVERMAGYCGTKHAVRGISQSMFKELRNFGIKVTCIYPGSVKTNFFDDFKNIEANDNMMMPEDIAGTIIHVLQSSPNYHHVDIEVRPLRPKGR